MNTIHHPVDNDHAARDTSEVTFSTIVVFEGPAAAFASGISPESVFNLIFGTNDANEGVTNIKQLEIEFQEIVKVEVDHRFFLHTETCEPGGLDLDGTVQQEFIAGKICLAGADDPDVAWRATEESLKTNQKERPTGGAATASERCA